MYRKIFDDKHQIFALKIGTKIKPIQIFSGEYETEILCKECDNNLLGKFESYAKMVLYGGKVDVRFKNLRFPDGLEFTQVENIDYTKFKLFLLSLLWRASISSRPFFNTVQLGPYEEMIRRMIIEGNPGPKSAFPCLFLSNRANEILTLTISGPNRFRNGYSRGYSFLINGMAYIFLVNENEKTDWILDVVLNENGKLKIIHSSEDYIAKQINSFLL